MLVAHINTSHIFDAIKMLMRAYNENEKSNIDAISIKWTLDWTGEIDMCDAKNMVACE